MICFLVCRGYGFTVRPLQQDPGAPEITVVSYGKALSASSLPKATYIFVDLDRLSSAELVAAGRLFRRLAAGGCRVLNDPARVLTRLPLLRNLYRCGINGFNVFSIDEADSPKRFPVFIRVADDHVGPLTDLIEDQKTLERAIEALTGIGYPRSALVVVEYAAEPVRPGIFRKLSIFRVADRYLPHVCVHDAKWTIKAGRSGAAPRELYDEELEILRTNPFAERMKPSFELAAIDFGRVDFSFAAGRPCIYEINTNPTLARPSPHAFPQRVESMTLWWEGLLSALHAIDDRAEKRSQIDVSADDAGTLRKALAIYPKIKDGFLDLGEEMSRKGDSAQAIHCAETALAQAPHDARVILRVRKLMADNGRLQDAIDIARRGIENDPDNLELLLQSAKLLARAQRAPEAVEAVQRAISMQPKVVKCYRALSEVYWLLGSFPGALQATNAAMKLVSESKGPAAAKQLSELRLQRRMLWTDAIRYHLRRAWRGILPLWR